MTDLDDAPTLAECERDEAVPCRECRLRPVWVDEDDLCDLCEREGL